MNLFKKPTARKEITMNVQHLQLLGKKVRDKVTGVQGTVTSVCFDLYGCILAIVTVKAVDNKVVSGNWFDVARLQVLDETPVIRVPDFTEGYIAEGLKGASQDLPIPSTTEYV